MITDQDVRELARNFPKLSARQIMLVAESGDTQVIPNGSTLLSSDAADDVVYLVMDGLLRVRLEDGARAVAYLARGQSIASAAGRQPAGRASSVEVVREARLVRVPGPVYRQFGLPA